MASSRPFTAALAALMLAAALAVACDASMSPAPSAGTSPPAATRLPARLSGALRLVDGCLRVQASGAPEGVLLVWPVDITATVYLQTVVVLDEGTRQQATWQTGEIVTIGGGNVPGIGDGVRRVGPNSCTGPYWLVGSVAPSATATPP